jgi:hypothetical protein
VTRFEKTVMKIAQSSDKLWLLKHAVPLLVKEGAKPPVATETLFRRVFGGDKQTAGQKIMSHVAQGTLLTGVTAAGALLAAQLQDKFLGNTDQAKATNSEIGKLTAQNRFKTQMVNTLQPQHTAVLKNVLQDEIINKADKTMIVSAFETMKRFAPNLAADENATRSFLREHAIYGTGPSYASLKNLADAEQAVARAGGALPL